MDIKTFWKTQPEPVKVAIAERAGTTIGYLRQCRGGSRQVSVGLAMRLVTASNGLLTLHELRPDIWDDPHAPPRIKLTQLDAAA
jgi:DNA-binding transcriptional regulator YdaS (Cro superfamily)